MKKLTVLFFSTCVLFCSTVLHAAWSEYSRPTDNSEITMSTVTTRVRLIIDEPISINGTIRYSTSTLNQMVNTAQQLMCLSTLALETYAEQSLTGGTTEYLIPTNCIAITRVTIDLDDGNGAMYIPQKTVHHLDSDHGKSWSVQSSTPTLYYLRNRYIGFYPAPISNPTVRVWYVKIPATMTLGSDYIFDGFTQLEIYWEALASYVAYKILLAEGRTMLLDNLASEYTGAINAIKSWINLKPDLEMDLEGAKYNQ